MIGKTWSNISGSIYIECGMCDCGDLIDCYKDKSLPISLKDELLQIFGTLDNQFWCEIEIPFLSSGYYDPGRTYGDPYYCYPPEGDDERILDDRCIVYIHTEGKLKEKHFLSNIVSNELFDLYLDDIMNEELDFSQYDDSDYKYERMIEDKLF